MAMGIARASA